MRLQPQEVESGAAVESIYHTATRQAITPRDGARESAGLCLSLLKSSVSAVDLKEKNL